MVPEIAQNEDLQKRIILRSPFGILACPAYAPYNDVEDKSESLLNLPESSFQQPMIKLTGTERNFAESALHQGNFVNDSLLHKLVRVVRPELEGRLDPPRELWYWLRHENNDVKIFGNGNAGMVSSEYRYKFCQGTTKTAMVSNRSANQTEVKGPTVRQFCLAVRGPPPRSKKVKRWAACYTGDRDGDLSTHHLYWRPWGYWTKGRQ
mmetsp:Transcript_23515/g.65969  ORF Transcript_23515/g.65969 Transcript_23515/m.65969 type:complete len:207 (-) Transcript_23515:1219-1839(-)